MHTNAEIAELLDPEHKRAGWWEHEVDIDCRTIWEPRLPDFYTDDIACFKELRPVLRAMGAHILERPDKILVRITCQSLFYDFVEDDPDMSYAAAVTAAFSWAMDNQPEALRRACEEVDRG